MYVDVNQIICILLDKKIWFIAAGNFYTCKVKLSENRYHINVSLSFTEVEVSY